MMHVQSKDLVPSNIENVPCFLAEKTGHKPETNKKLDMLAQDLWQILSGTHRTIIILYFIYIYIYIYNMIMSLEFILCADRFFHCGMGRVPAALKRSPSSMGRRELSSESEAKSWLTTTGEDGSFNLVILMDINVT